MNTKKRLRNKSALERLKAQLKSGVKNTKLGEIPLTDSDKIRINKEINTLEKRI